ncbi:MAG: flagellar hook-length control protein FliK [Pseudomonadota bacterium]
MARGLDIASLQTRADFGASAVPRAPASAAAAADGQNAASQIAAAINRASGDRIDLRLDPPELGRVAVSLAVRDDAMIASITADRPETEALLRRHGEELQKALRDSGFEDVSLAFGDQGDNDPKAGDGRAADLVEATMSERETAVETTANARRSDAGLDLRV